LVDESTAKRFDNDKANVSAPSTKERNAADPANLLLA
jgi:hypothetical protein